MIRLILLLLQLLGFENNKNKPVYSLHKQTTPEKIVICPEMKLLIWGIVGIGLFFILIFMFAPGTESGVWYNNPHY